MKTHYDILYERTSRRKRIYAHVDRIHYSYAQTECMAPITLEIFPTDACNSHCFFCAYPKISPITLSEKAFSEIITFCIEYGVKGVTFSGGGEPTLHPYLPTAIHRLSCAGISVGLITNGVFISRELRKELPYCSWIRFSLLCSDSKQYQKFTTLDSEAYQRVLCNINNISTDCQSTILGATMMLTDSLCTKEAITAFIDLACSLGLDQVFFTELLTKIGSYSLNRAKLQEYEEIIKSYSKKKHIITNIEKFIHGMDKSFLRLPDHQCGIIERNLINLITAGGNVYSCPSLYNVSHGLPLGNIYQDPLSEVLQKENIDKKTAQIKHKNCSFCKNSTTRFELLDYLSSGRIGYVNDPHYNFL